MNFSSTHDSIHRITNIVLNPTFKKKFSILSLVAELTLIYGMFLNFSSRSHESEGVVNNFPNKSDCFLSMKHMMREVIPDRRS